MECALLIYYRCLWQTLLINPVPVPAQPRCGFRIILQAAPQVANLIRDAEELTLSTILLMRINGKEAETQRRAKIIPENTTAVNSQSCPQHTGYSH